MITEADQLKRQKTKRWIWIMTLIYMIPFPFLLYASLFSVAILNPSGIGIKLLQWTFVLLFLAIPLSIPFSIFFMWRSYFQKKYSEASFYFVLPIIVTVICYFLIEFVGLFLTP
jgi:hypothetical protein